MRRILIDAEKCDGCKNCSVACMNAHRRDTEEKELRTLNLSDPTNESRNFIRLTEEKRYQPIFCRHCDAPACVQGCMSGALEKNSETGLVEYSQYKCGQCFMCVMNCPYGVPKPDRATQTYVVKCDFCQHSGGEPSCVKLCPKKAIWVEEVDV